MAEASRGQQVEELQAAGERVRYYLAASRASATRKAGSGCQLAYLSTIALVLAFVHPWRTSRRFLLLTGASVLVFVACAVLGPVVGEDSAAGAVVFYIALFLCPAGLLVGIIGAVVPWVTSRRAHHVPPASPVAWLAHQPDAHRSHVAAA